MRTRNGASPYRMSDDSTQRRCWSTNACERNSIFFRNCLNYQFQSVPGICLPKQYASSQSHFTLELGVPKSFWLHLCEIRPVKILFVAFIKVQTIGGAQWTQQWGSCVPWVVYARDTLPINLVCVALTILNPTTQSKLVSIALAYSAFARVISINIGFRS